MFNTRRVRNLLARILYGYNYDRFAWPFTALGNGKVAMASKGGYDCGNSND